MHAVDVVAADCRCGIAGLVVQAAATTAVGLPDCPPTRGCAGFAVAGSAEATTATAAASRNEPVMRRMGSLLIDAVAVVDVA